jgi:thiol-disulfide isomerase/thioredoxin
MNNLIKNSVLILIFTIVFSVLTGCSSSANSDKQTASENNSVANSESGETSNTPKVNSEYPPIPSALAQIEIKKIDDSTFKLEEKKGNVVLLNLWATWCGPCRGEMPHLVEMEEKYKPKNFEVIGLNTDDESVEDINKFAAEMKLNYQMAYADTAMMKEFLNISKFQGIPQSFLIDREGRLRGVFLGGGPKVIGTMKETVEKVVNE